MILNSKLTVSNLVFDILTEGESYNEPVILLHGFPETNHMWASLMQDLGKNGFYCVAPNQRGYSPGARPNGKRNYSIENLTNDILQISRTLGVEKFHLVGHDWGAIVGWHFVQHHPDLILSWSALSVPHSQAYCEAVLHDPTQRRMSTYVRSFQVPWLPEYKIKKNDFALLKRLWKNSSKAEMDDYLSVFRESGMVTSAINYYRANYKLLMSSGKTRILGNIHVPTLFIWGENDFAIAAYGVEKCNEYVKGDYNFVKVKGGHWLIQTNYDELAFEIIDHLNKYKT